VAQKMKKLGNRNDDLAKELKAHTIELNGETYLRQIPSSELRCETLANMILADHYMERRK